MYIYLGKVKKLKINLRKYHKFYKKTLEILENFLEKFFQIFAKICRNFVMTMILENLKNFLVKFYECDIKRFLCKFYRYFR